MDLLRGYFTNGIQHQCHNGYQNSLNGIVSQKNAEYTANLVRSAISEAAKMRESDDDMM